MHLEIYQVDAFCRELFTGNPAAVCPLEYWPDDRLLQNIAMENNLAETSFFVHAGDHFEIRWFTPTVEVALCGHATLATAHVLYNHMNVQKDKLRFSSKSGDLFVTRHGDGLLLDFPKDNLVRIDVTEEMVGWFNLRPLEAFKGNIDYLLVFAEQSQIEDLVPNLEKIRTHTEVRGVIATAKGTQVDMVSRFFAPQAGIPEDPVTGSAHTSLVAYWAEKSGKDQLEAIQLSPRKGYLSCTNDGDRVRIQGLAKTYLSGRINVQ
jgi:predicted PhzF superfamily epimerase YddE/YHI9